MFTATLSPDVDAGPTARPCRPLPEGGGSGWRTTKKALVYSSRTHTNTLAKLREDKKKREKKKKKKKKKKKPSAQ